MFQTFTSSIRDSAAIIGSHPIILLPLLSANPTKSVKVVQNSLLVLSMLNMCNKLYKQEYWKGGTFNVRPVVTFSIVTVFMSLYGYEMLFRK